MRSAGSILAVAMLLAATAHADEAKMHHPPPVVSSEAIEWGPAPPGLPPGSKAAVLTGDPGAAGSFTLRAWLPAGYQVPPHWHATVEHLTLISGKLVVGMGDTVDRASATTLLPGGYAVMPPEMRHWVIAETETVLQVHGDGPFAITYVNPADDPRSSSSPSR